MFLPLPSFLDACWWFFWAKGIQKAGGWESCWALPARLVKNSAAGWRSSQPLRLPRSSLRMLCLVRLQQVVSPDFSCLPKTSPRFLKVASLYFLLEIQCQLPTGPPFVAKWFGEKTQRRCIKHIWYRAARSGTSHSGANLVRTGSRFPARCFSLVTKTLLFVKWRSSNCNLLRQTMDLYFAKDLSKKQSVYGPMRNCEWPMKRNCWSPTISRKVFGSDSQMHKNIFAPLPVGNIKWDMMKHDGT